MTDRKITVEPQPGRVQAAFRGTVLADSAHTLLLKEEGHDPVYYFPESDVRFDCLTATDHRTHCPYKGDASYFTIETEQGRAENAVWRYENPLESVAEIKDCLAFYPNRVSFIAADD